MDRWLSLIPAVLLALSLAACGQVEPDAPAPGGAVPPAAADSPLAEGEDASETPRAVMTGGVLYYDTGRESSVTGRCGNLDGEITSRCAADALPEKDGECNFTGADGWQRGPEEGPQRMPSSVTVTVSPGTPATYFSNGRTCPQEPGAT